MNLDASSFAIFTVTVMDVVLVNAFDDGVFRSFHQHAFQMSLAPFADMMFLLIRSQCGIERTGRFSESASASANATSAGGGAAFVSRWAARHCEYEGSSWMNKNQKKKYRVVI